MYAVPTLGGGGKTDQRTSYRQPHETNRLSPKVAQEDSGGYVSIIQSPSAALHCRPLPIKEKWRLRSLVCLGGDVYWTELKEVGGMRRN